MLQESESPPLWNELTESSRMIQNYVSKSKLDNQCNTDNGYNYRCLHWAAGWPASLFIPLIFKDSELIVFYGFVVLANTELPVNLLTQWTPLQTCLTGKMQAALSGHISFRLSIHSFLHEMQIRSSETKPWLFNDPLRQLLYSHINKPPRLFTYAYEPIWEENTWKRPERLSDLTVMQVLLCSQGIWMSFL